MPDANLRGSRARPQFPHWAAGERRCVDPPAVYWWHPHSKEDPIKDAKVAARQTATGYTLEAAIPIQFLRALKPGAELGFEALVSDTDTPEVPQKCMRSLSPSYKYAAPRTWGRLRFEDE